MPDPVDIQTLLLNSFNQIYPALLKNPTELQKRLARQNTPLLTRPPRSSCLAVRASDTRINLSTAAISPELPVYPRHALSLDLLRSSKSQPSPHQVLLDAQLLRLLCRPITIPHPGLPWTQVAASLGLHPESLRYAMRIGLFKIHYPQHSGRGKPVPHLYSPKTFDPSSSNLKSPPDPVWGCLWQHLANSLPDSFSQPITRIPRSRPRNANEYDEHRTHFRKPLPHLPPPPPDYVWYKWKDGVYMGYDSRNSHAAANYHRFQTRRAKARAAAKRRYQKIPYGYTTGSQIFRGWNWLCPQCQKPTRTLFLPLPVMSIPRFFGLDLSSHLSPSLIGGSGSVPTSSLSPSPGTPGEGRGEGRASPAGNQQPPTNDSPHFACVKCHQIQYFTRLDRNSWNHLVSHLTGGLLYGHEVPCPYRSNSSHHPITQSPHHPTRKRAYRANIMRPPSERRAQVLELLLKGYMYKDIAQKLGVGYGTVHAHVKTLYKQCNVHSRSELLRFYPLATSNQQLATRSLKRARVLALLEQGFSWKEISTQTGLSWNAVHHHVKNIRRGKNRNILSISTT